MSKYILLYRGPATPMENFTEEQGAEQMRAWGEWGERTGSALTDFGSPFGARTSVGDDGSTPAPSELNGYTIVEAKSHEAAARLFLAHPHFTIFPGDGVEIMECLPMPEMPK